MTDAFLFYSGVALDVAKVVAIRLKRDIEELLSMRKPLAIAGRQTKVVSGFYALRPLGQGAEPILFLFHAGKRSIPRSPDRNKQKRRLREAVRKLDIYDDITGQLRTGGRQALVLVRATKPPSAQSSWEMILGDMEKIGLRLKEMVGSRA